MVVYDNKIFITQRPNYMTTPSQTPVSVMIDTVSGKQESLPFRFPPFAENTEEYMQLLRRLEFSRCFDGAHFIYSFELEEDIYIASIDHQKVEKRNAKSRYIDKVAPEKRVSDLHALYRQALESPYYGNLLYDKYREVYYRFAFPGIDTNQYSQYNFQDIFMSGSPKFSVIIMDKDFNIIGETLFPENIYNPEVVFVNEDGLYVSNIHTLNPAFNEDILSFQCFELSKN
jgi:hypothetical protein